MFEYPYLLRDKGRAGQGRAVSFPPIVASSDYVAARCN